MTLRRFNFYYILAADYVDPLRRFNRASRQARDGRRNFNFFTCFISKSLDLTYSLAFFFCFSLRFSVHDLLLKKYCWCNAFKLSIFFLQLALLGSLVHDYFLAFLSLMQKVKCWAGYLILCFFLIDLFSMEFTTTRKYELWFNSWPNSEMDRDFSNEKLKLLGILCKNQEKKRLKSVDVFEVLKGSEGSFGYFVTLNLGICDSYEKKLLWLVRYFKNLKF